MSELDKLEKYLREHNYDYERIEEPRSEVNLLGMAIDWSRHQIVVYKKLLIFMGCNMPAWFIRIPGRTS